MYSKLSFHFIGQPDAYVDKLRGAGAKVAKVYDWSSDQSTLYGAFDLIVYRHYFEQHYDAISPQAAIDQLPLNNLRGRGIVWELDNEPVISTVAQAQALSAWYVEAAAILHSMGEHIAAYSFSTGNPPLDLVPYLADGLYACDYGAMHEYWHPDVQFAMIGRYKEFLARIPYNKRRQILITETGADSGGCRDCGWLALGLTPTQYMDILKQIDSAYLRDDWLAGAMIFQCGGGDPWDKFNVASLVTSITDYIKSQGGGILPRQPFVISPSGSQSPSDSQSPSAPIGPSSSISPSYAPEVILVSLTPDHVQVGGQATLEWNISGVKEIYLNNEGVGGWGKRIISANNVGNQEFVFKILRTNDEWIQVVRTLVVESIGTTSPADPKLAWWPRPKNDNGWGLHFVLDAAQANVEGYAPWLGKLQMKWTTVYGGDELQVTRVAKYLLDNFGIFSVMRVYASGDKPKVPDFWRALAERCVSMKIPPYIQIFNEPEDGREGFDTIDLFARKWNARAQAVVDAGGFAGLQVLSEEFLAAAVAGMSDTVKAKLFFVLHNYGANHPPKYPYPNKTVLEDDTAVLRFIAIAEWFKKYLGFVPPMIGGEGGWLYQNADDKTMPPVTADLWTPWHLEMYDWFRTGILSNGQPLPDYLFSVHPWLLYASNWYSDSWVNGLDAEKKQPLLDALQNATPFVRLFGRMATGPSHSPSPSVSPSPHLPSSSISPSIQLPSSSVSPSPAPEEVLDPQLAAEGINILVVDGVHYKVKRVWMQSADALPVLNNDQPESRNVAKIDVYVYNRQGHLLEDEIVIMSTSPTDVAATTTIGGHTDFDMDTAGWSFNPEFKPRGPGKITVGDCSFDGCGLPVSRHVRIIGIIEKQ